jgi:hypothetical protein
VRFECADSCVLEVADDGVGLPNNGLRYFAWVVCVRRLVRLSEAVSSSSSKAARAAAVQDGSQATALARYAAIKASGQTKKGYIAARARTAPATATPV